MSVSVCASVCVCVCAIERYTKAERPHTDLVVCSVLIKQHGEGHKHCDHLHRKHADIHAPIPALATKLERGSVTRGEARVCNNQQEK